MQNHDNINFNKKTWWYKFTHKRMIKFLVMFVIWEINNSKKKKKV